jgi:hypothetical protein
MQFSLPVILGIAGHLLETKMEFHTRIAKEKDFTRRSQRAPREEGFTRGSQRSPRERKILDEGMRISIIPLFLAYPS